VVEAMVLTKDVGKSGDSVHHSITYRFTTDDGRTLEGKSEVSESIWNAVTERGPVSVAYMPGRPSSNAVVGASKRTLLLIFSLAGLVLSTVGGTLVVVSLRKSRTARRLLTAGVRAPATVTEVRPLNLRVNGRTQWRLKYEYHDYQSRPYRRAMYLDADEAMHWKPGDTGDVLFDPDRPATSVWLGKVDEGTA